MPVKVDIIRQKENKVLKRKEVDFRIEHVGGTTPSRADIRATIAAQLDSDPSTVVIRSLATRFGIGVTEGRARIYNDVAQAKRVEVDYILKRHEPKKKEGEGEAEKPEEAPAKPEKKKPEKKEAAPVEEIAEETPEVEEAAPLEMEAEGELEAEEEVAEKAPKVKEAAPAEKKGAKGKKAPEAEEKPKEKTPEKKKEGADKKEAAAGKKKSKGEKEES